LPFLAIAFLGFFTFLLDTSDTENIIFTIMFFSIGAPLFYFGYRARKRWKGVINSVLYMSREQGKVDISAIAQKLDMSEVDVVEYINKAQAKDLIPSGALAAPLTQTSYSNITGANPTSIKAGGAFGQDESYKVIFTGEIAAGYEIDTVKKNFADLFKVDTKRIERLFTGYPVLIKDKVNYEKATNYEQTLKKAGAICRVEPEQVVPPATHFPRSLELAQKKSDWGKGLIKRLAFGTAWFVIIYVVAYIVVICILAVVIVNRGIEPGTAEAVGEAMGRKLAAQYNDLFLVGALASSVFGTVFGILPGTKKKTA
jgi:hypothetical protein